MSIQSTFCKLILWGHQSKENYKKGSDHENSRVYGNKRNRKLSKIKNDLISAICLSSW